MKFIYQTLATIILSFAVQYFLPWWTMPIVAFILGYLFDNKSGISFLAGFIGVGILWFAMAYNIDASTQSILTEKMNKLLPLNVFVMTFIVGGLPAGFAAFSGALLKKKKKSWYY